MQLLFIEDSYHFLDYPFPTSFLPCWFFETQGQVADQIIENEDGL